MLILLWQPAITVAELKPQQNIIARAGGRLAQHGHRGRRQRTRQAQAVKALQGGVLGELAEEISDATLQAR